MKKTCGALVIGLLITTNVYAKEIKVSACEDKTVKSMVMLLRQGSVDKKWKPTEMQCESIRYMMNAAFESAYSLGYEYGISTKSSNNCLPCPSCDDVYNVPLQNNDIKKQEELDNVRREQYYLNQNMNRHK